MGITFHQKLVRPARNEASRSNRLQTNSQPLPVAVAGCQMSCGAQVCQSWEDCWSLTSWEPDNCDIMQSLGGCSSFSLYLATLCFFWVSSSTTTLLSATQTSPSGSLLLGTLAYGGNVSSGPTFGRRADSPLLLTRSSFFG